MPASDHPSTFDTDVIIVGAGPIGLTTACALRHHGVHCRLFEERTKPKEYSRANNVWARPQELLESIGVREALAEKSYRIEKQTVFLDGHPLDQVPLDQVKSPYAKVFYSGQDVIENTLSEQVAQKGGSVERGRKVVGIEQDVEGVTVMVETVSEDGQSSPPERLRCRYLIGADGTGGTTRKAVGLDFENEKFEGRATRQIDAKLSWRRSTEPDQLWFFVYHNGFAGVLPVWGGYHRMFFLEEDSVMPERDPTLEEMQAHAREITGDETLTFTDPVWFSYGRFKHGVAAHYAKDRVFFVGDAGHHTLPIGGQGMNAGMHDAVGLAWRLATVLAGHAGPAILDSYDSERQGQHADLDDNQAKGFRRLVYRNRVEDWALDAAAKVVPNLGSKMFGSDDLQQLSVRYPKSPLSEDHLGLRQALQRHVPHAGDRAPDAEVVNGTGATVNLFRHIYNPDGRTWGWSLLAFDGRQEDAGPRLRTALAEFAAWDWIRPRLLLASPAATKGEPRAATMELFDLDAQAHSAYGLDGIPALVLIRPDGHIAFRGPAHRPELLRTYCEKVFR